MKSDANTKRAENACSFGTTTISQFSDATAITSCATLTGDVVIATDMADDNIVIEGPSEIQGSLIVEDVSSSVKLKSSTLQTITGSLKLYDVQILSEVDLPQLQSVDTVDILGVPNLQIFTPLETLEQVHTISVQNTELGDLQGFRIQSLDTLIIANNPYLATVVLQPYNITGSLSVEANGRNFDLSMPNVQEAEDVTFRNVSSLNIPQLMRVSGKFSLTGNYITSLDGMPSVRSIDGGLVISDNDAMKSMSLTLLESIDGGLQISNNSALTVIDNLYNLATVTGDVEIIGDFSNITFPALTALNGSLNITSNKAMSCNPFDDLYRNDVVKQHYYCHTASDTGVSDRSLPVSPSQSSAEGTSSTAAGASSGPSAVQLGVGIGVGVGGALIIAGALWFIFRRRRTAKRSQTSHAAEVEGSEVDRAAMVAGGEKHELQQPTDELPAGLQAQELQAAHGQSELSQGDSTKSPTGLQLRHEMPSNETPPRK